MYNEDGCNFTSTLKIQDQVYYKIGSLFSMTNADQTFLHVDRYNVPTVNEITVVMVKK